MLTVGVSADDEVVRSGPFEIFSTAGTREAQDAANFAEQLRYTLGWQLGNTELQTTWPVRVLVVKQKHPVQPACALARDASVCSISEPGPEFAASLTKVLLDSWPGHLPPPLERGLIQLYSTIQIDGTKITLGTPPAQKDRDWTRAHMLSVDPNYSGKLRIMLANLGKGIEPEVAYRNAFGEAPEEIERSVDRHLEAGSFGTLNAPSRPLNARKQLIAKDAAPADLKLLEADLLLAAGRPEAQAAYQAILTPEAHEGLGLIALRNGNKEEARKQLANSTDARGLVEYAKLLDDPEAKRAALTKATTANPRWAEPWRMLAAIELHPAQKLAALKKATGLEAQNPSLWVELAQLQESAKQFTDAAKSWAMAERATADPEARDRVRQSRLAGDRRRIDADIAAKDEARRKTEAELNALRNKALMGIREAEARANAGKPVIDASKLDVYKEGDENKKVTGTLQRVDCHGKQATLRILKGRQITTLLVADPTQVAISGGGHVSLICGTQKRSLGVTVEYTPRSEAGQGIAGDVVAIEFR
jgi:hypothetical protein